MCNYLADKQFAYIDPQGKFHRLGTPITNKEQMKAVAKAIPHKAVYESVYGWKNWKGGKITPEISKTAIIDGVFFDFDDAANPLAAIRDAAEVAWYIGHSTTNFSGSKGAHVLIHCYPVDLIPDLKSAVLRGFANMLADHLPELTTMDWAVIGDTSRVHRIIDSVHPGTKLHAIGLTAEELATLTIDEIHEMAANRRGLIQVPEPSRWVTAQLWTIQDEILEERLTRLYHREQISHAGYHTAIRRLTRTTFRDRVGMFDEIKALEDEWQRILLKNAPKTNGITGRSPEETWLLKVVKIFEKVQRMNSIRPAGSKVSTSSSEHEARCHITHLMDDCGWRRGDMHRVFSHADDYTREKTERQINSLIGRR